MGRSCRTARGFTLIELLEVINPDVPVTLNADRARLSQALMNLLNNAAKFTPAGGRITLLVETSDSGATICVRDTGAGIPAEMLSRIFETFTQIDNSLSRKKGGLGIGLSIVRTIVEMHGGTVEARSEGPGRGSEFLVRLPVPSHETNDSSFTAPPASDNNGSARHDLVGVHSRVGTSCT